MQNNPFGEFIARPFGKYFPQDEHFINSSFSLSKSKFSTLRSFDNPTRIPIKANIKNIFNIINRKKKNYSFEALLNLFKISSA